MVSIRLMPIPLTIDEDDLMTEKNQDTLRLKSGSLLDVSRVRSFVYFGNKKKREFRRVQRERVYEAVRHIHVTPLQ
jgi:hypothetical protein